MDSISPKKLYRYAFSKITVLVLLSLLVSALILSVANDVYAFVKPDISCEFEINEPVSASELSRLMQKNGVISNPFVFLIYATLQHKTEALESFRGSVRLNSNMSYREILGFFSD